MLDVFKSCPSSTRPLEAIKSSGGKSGAYPSKNVPPDKFSSVTFDMS